MSDSAATRAARLAFLLMQRGRLTTARAASLLGVSRRVALTDLKRIAEVTSVRSRGEGRDREWILDPLEGVTVALVDQISLNLGREVTSFLRGTPLWEGLERVSLRRESIPDRYRDDLDRKFRMKAEPHRRYDGTTETMWTVLDALLRCRALDLEYAGARGGHRTYTAFRPLTLVLYRRAVYLLGDVDGSAPVRLAIERIRSCEVGEGFEYPRDWDPDEALGPWFGIARSKSTHTVALRFDPNVAPYVMSRQWHASATLQREEDGHVLLTMQTGGPELLRFVLEWGSHVEVLEPLSLREEVAAELRAAAERYAVEAESPDQLHLFVEALEGEDERALGQGETG